MSTSIVFPIASLPSGASIDQLEQEVIDDVNIPVQITGVTVSAEDVTFDFQAALDTAQQAALAALVAAHVPGEGEAAVTVEKEQQTQLQVSIVIDDDSDKNILGTVTFVRDQGGRFVPPTVAVFPTDPVLNEVVFKSDDNAWYRYDGSNWVLAHNAQFPHSILLGLDEGNDHPQYQLRSERGQANGYAGVGADSSISDATHGQRSGGDLHQKSSGTVDGFMSKEHFTKLEGLSQPDLSPYQPKSEKGSPNGYPDLDSSGKIPSAQLPAVAIPELFFPADKDARLALVAQKGDEAFQVDDGSQWINDGSQWVARPSSTSYETRASNTDTTPGFLDQKLTAGAGVVITKVNEGGDESLEISSTATGDGAFGSDYHYAEALGETYSTAYGSSNPTQKLQLDATVEGGTYRLGWTVNLASSGNNKNICADVRNGNSTVDHYERRFRDSEHIVFAGEAHFTLTAGDHTFYIRFWRNSSSTTAQAKNARLTLWRVA